MFTAIGAQRVSDEVFWQLADQQGTIRNIVGQHGHERKAIDYDSFGNVTGEQYYGSIGLPSTTLAIDQLFGYTGQEWDQDAKLQNNNARWYDPRLGRFLSEDPLGLADDPNRYRYVGNSPTNATDPTGLYQAGNPLNSLYGSLANSPTPLITSTPTLSTIKYASLSTAKPFATGNVPLYVDRSLVAPTSNAPSRAVNQLDQLLIKSEQGQKLNGGEKVFAQLLYHTRDATALGGFPDVATRMALAGISVPPRSSSSLFTPSGPGSGPLINPTTYASRTFDQLILGEYSDQSPTAASVGVGVAAGLVGADLPGDLRDLSHYLTNWQWSFGHAGNTALNAASMLPVFGVLKYADEGAEVVQGAVKNAASSVPSGGRLGSATTRQHVGEVAGELRSRGYEVTGGGGVRAEEYIPSAAGRKGSAYPDITATKNGRTLRINTVDTLTDAVTPTAREAANAAKIRQLKPNEHLLLVPKPKR